MRASFSCAAMPRAAYCASRQGRRHKEDRMQTIRWGQLCPAIRRALLREAVRRDVDVEVLFVSLGGVL